MIINVKNYGSIIDRKVSFEVKGRIIGILDHRVDINGKYREYTANFNFIDSKNIYRVIRGGPGIQKPIVYSADKMIGQFNYNKSLTIEGKTYRFYYYFEKNCTKISVFLDGKVQSMILRNIGQRTDNKIFDYTIYLEDENIYKEMIILICLFHESVYDEFLKFETPPKTMINIGMKGKKMYDQKFVDYVKSLEKQ